MIVRHVNLTVEPGAAERVAELGLEEEMERVLARTREMISSLGEVSITLRDDMLEPSGKALRLSAIKDSAYVRRDPERAQWTRAIVDMTSNEFRRWVLFDVFPREMLNGR